MSDASPPPVTGLARGPVTVARPRVTSLLAAATATGSDDWRAAQLYELAEPPRHDLLRTLPAWAARQAGPWELINESRAAREPVPPTR